MRDCQASTVSAYCFPARGLRPCFRRHRPGEHGRSRRPVRADAAQIQQVTVNLAVNARHAMTGSGNGKLTIETGNVDVDQESASANPGMRPGPHVRMVVRDNGRGMSPETLSHVFEPFFATRAVGLSAAGEVELVPGPGLRRRGRSSSCVSCTRTLPCQHAPRARRGSRPQRVGGTRFRH